MHASSVALIRRTLVLAIAALLTAGTTAHAQCSTCVEARRSHATRAELESLAVRTEESITATQPAEAQRKRLETTRIRERLKSGDFLPGDRIILTVEGDAALSDTFTVRAGGLLSLPNLPDASLSGILRSELQAHLTRHIARYLRNPSVTASSLIRLAVIGEVQRPGFYPVPADAPLSDIVMAAGGPTQTADLGRMTIRRGSTELLSPADLRIAVVNGLTVDQLNLLSGDEISVGAKPRTNWALVLTGVTAVMGIVTTVVSVSN